MIDIADADRARADRRVARFPRRRRARRRTRSRCRPTARRCSSPTPTTTPSRWSTSSEPGRSEVEGFIPTGWYPTAVLFDRDGARLFVLDGKGLIGQANPRGPQPGSPRGDGQYTGRAAAGHGVGHRRARRGARSPRYTARVIELSRRTPTRRRLTPAGAPAASPIPRRVGDPSPIKHVFYVIRENRTYDQVLGDLEQGNGDPSLAIFGEEVTPNAHALAREFVLFDNFYVDAEVSYDGHAFSTGAYATDVVEKLWPTNYGRRGGAVPERGRLRRCATPYGNLVGAADGYIWDFADARRRQRPQLRRVRRLGRHEPGRHAAVEATRARARGQGPSDLSALRPVDPRQPGASTSGWRSSGEFEANGELPRLIDHPPGQRPHLRHAPGRADAARDGGRERPRARPARRGDLAAAASGRSRRSSCSKTTRRTGPTTSTRTARSALVISPFTQRGARRQHALHDVRHAADDGADPRPAADEPVRRRRDADVQRVPDRRRTLTPFTRAARARAARREERRPTPGAPRRRWR